MCTQGDVRCSSPTVIDLRIEEPFLEISGDHNLERNCYPIDLAGIEERRQLSELPRRDPSAEDGHEERPHDLGGEESLCLDPGGRMAEMLVLHDPLGMGAKPDAELGRQHSE